MWRYEFYIGESIVDQGVADLKKIHWLWQKQCDYSLHVFKVGTTSGIAVFHPYHSPLSFDVFEKSVLSKEYK